jgi:hypothetical protein
VEPIPLSKAEATLSAAGYQVTSRSDVWHEVFVSRGEERWVGRGTTLELAMADALAQMAPSHIAQQHLLEAIEHAPSRLNGATKPLRPAPPGVDAALHVFAPRPPPAPGAVVAPAASRRALVTPAQLDEAHEGLDRVLYDIRTRYLEVAMLSADRQRLLLLQWACRIRAAEECAPNDENLGRHAAQALRVVRELSRRFWPGPIGALQRAAKPAEVGEFKAFAPERVPGTWMEAVESMKHVLEAHAAEMKRTGHDEHGWFREDVAQPVGARNVAKTLQEAKAHADKLAELADEERTISDAEIRKLARFAARLRDIRLHVDQPAEVEQWGETVGTMRRIAGKLRPKASDVLTELHPTRSRAA